MFGYIRPQKSELLVREYEQYRGIYCSLCKQLGKSYGPFCRFTLSYDCTFLAMVAIGLSQNACPSFFSGRCVVNPLKKCAYCKGGENSFVFSAALSVIMTYYKVKDDIQDSGFGGRIRAYLALPFLWRPHKRAASQFPKLEQAVAGAIFQQKELENSGESSIDASAASTAEMLAKVFSLLAKGEKEQRVLHQFGYYVGRWVYLIDAADDLEKDLKKGSFNPFVLKFGLKRESAPEEIRQAKFSCNQVLNLTLSQAIGALELLEFNAFGPIIKNIMYLGLAGIQRERLFASEKEKKNV